MTIKKFIDKNCIKMLLFKAFKFQIKMFFKEHLHTDEEIRFILDGGGYFDVRDSNDKYVLMLIW